MKDVMDFMRKDNEALLYLVNEIFKLGYDDVNTVETERNGSIYLYFYKRNFVKIQVHNKDTSINIFDMNGERISRSDAYKQGWIFLVRLSDHKSSSATNVNLEVILNNGNYAVFEKDSNNIIKLV